MFLKCQWNVLEWKFFVATGTLHCMQWFFRGVKVVETPYNDHQFVHTTHGSVGLLTPLSIMKNSHKLPCETILKSCVSHEMWQIYQVKHMWTHVVIYVFTCAFYATACVHMCFNQWICPTSCETHNFRGVSHVNTGITHVDDTCVFFVWACSFVLKRYIDMAAHHCSTSAQYNLA